MIGTAVVVTKRRNLTKSETTSNAVEGVEDNEEQYEHVVDEVVVDVLGNAVANDPSTYRLAAIANFVIRFVGVVVEVVIVKLFVTLVVGMLSVLCMSAHSEEELDDEDAANKVLEERACACECKFRECCCCACCCCELCCVGRSDDRCVSEWWCCCVMYCCC